MCDLITERDVLKHAHKLEMHAKHPVEDCDDCFMRVFNNFKLACEQVLTKNGYISKLECFYKHMDKIKQRNIKNLVELHPGWFVAEFLKLNHNSSEFYNILYSAHPSKIKRN